MVEDRLGDEPRERGEEPRLELRVGARAHDVAGPQGEAGVAELVARAAGGCGGGLGLPLEGGLELQFDERHANYLEAYRRRGQWEEEEAQHLLVLSCRRAF